MAVGDPAPGSLQPGQFFINFSSRRQFVGVPTSIAADGFVLVSDHDAQDAAIANKVNKLYAGGLGLNFVEPNVVVRVDSTDVVLSREGHTHAIADIAGLQAALDAKGGDAFVPGMIMMWSGAVSQIPSGWGLCDGTLGKPDLRNRFIIGAGSDYAVGATGGAHTKTVTSTTNGAHAHGSATLPHTLDVAQIPSHTHEYSDPGHTHGITDPGHKHNLREASPVTQNGASNIYKDAPYQSTSSGLMSEAKTGITIKNSPIGITIAHNGGGQAHTHGIASDGAHNHNVTVDVRPLYYALAFIIKLAPEE